MELEDYVNTLFEDKDAKAALSKINAKAFPSLRQKIRKYMKELEGVTEYRASPDPIGYESPEEEVRNWFFLTSPLPRLVNTNPHSHAGCKL